jgi:hypothetical protein
MVHALAIALMLSSASAKGGGNACATLNIMYSKISIQSRAIQRIGVLRSVSEDIHGPILLKAELFTKPTGAKQFYVLININWRPNLKPECLAKKDANGPYFLCHSELPGGKHVIQVNSDTQDEGEALKNLAIVRREFDKVVSCPNGVTPDD